MIHNNRTCDLQAEHGIGKSGKKPVNHQRQVLEGTPDLPAGRLSGKTFHKPHVANAGDIKVAHIWLHAAKGQYVPTETF